LISSELRRIAEDCDSIKINMVISASQQPPQNGGNGHDEALSPPYRRASRKGAPRRFDCKYPGCDKLYSRAEHLQRHQLNRATAFPSALAVFSRARIR
jgi:hypothetical protein